MIQNNDKNFVWSKEIDDLFAQGRYLGDIGIKNWALLQEQALNVIARLELLGVPILGGDVYYLSGKKLQPALDNWYINRERQESLSDFVTRSITVSRDYVRHFRPRSGDVALFVIIPG